MLNAIVIALVIVVTSLPLHVIPADQEKTSPAAAYDTTVAADFECASADKGVTHSVEYNNRTGKTIFKILVKDHYHIILPDSSSAPVNITTKEIKDATPLGTTTEEMILETTTTDDLLYEETTPDKSDDGLSYDSLEELLEDMKDSSEIDFDDIILNERIRHSKPPPSWEEFCQQAAEEEEEPVLVSDGSFHPRYEQVLGVGVYRLHARARSWAAARRMCELEGAQLAVPNSREEALALAAIHNRCPLLLPSHFNDYQYIGIHDDYNEGNWETVVGHPLNETGYVKWAFNQPDNAHQHGENCLTMNRQAEFNDVPCWVLLPFICEHI